MVTKKYTHKHNTTHASTEWFTLYTAQCSGRVPEFSYIIHTKSLTVKTVKKCFYETQRENQLITAQRKKLRICHQLHFFFFFIFMGWRNKAHLMGVSWGR